MKKVHLILLVSFLLISCLPVFDFMEQMQIVNLTNDTILIGNATCTKIDSVKWFLDRWEAVDSTRTEIDNRGNLYVSGNNLIPPDSMGCYVRTSLFADSQGNKGYFFIIKLETTKNYSWNEICRNRLYDTLVVQREMLKNSNIVEYRGKTGSLHSK